MYKLIACDVDGTLLDSSMTKIPPRQFVQINNLTNMGVHFVIASGRSYGELYKLFAPVCQQVTYICNDGAQLISHGKTLYEISCDKSDISVINDFCIKEGLFIKFYLRETETADFYQTKINSVYKIYINNISNTQIDKLKSILPFGLYIAYQSGNMIELLPTGANKSIALTTYMQRFAIEKSEAVSFGDNHNDFYMLTCTGRSFRMTNSKADLSSVANEVTSSVYDTINDICFKKI